MKQLWFAAVSIFAFADPSVVYAGSHCGGGNGGGSSGGGSSGGGSSSGGSSSGGGSSSSSDSGGGSYASESPASTGCIDDTDVHGFRHCTKFGAWGKNLRFPRIFIEGGSNVRNFDSGLGDQTGSVTHGLESFSYRVVMPTASTRRDVALTSSLRVGFGIPHGFYSGLEFEIGGLVAPATATAEMTTTPGTFGSPNVSQTNGLVLGFSGIGGYRANGRRGSIAVEGAGGLRSVHYNFESNYHLCETSSTIVSTHSVVEARARAELWLNPWLTAGVTVGANVLEQADWMAGFYFGAHSRAFAGGR
ncbi:MAG TPA: hypothetical protein VIV40_02550 [Kofleriaceae bacterium]